jgi:hypothetical protein
MSKVRSNVRFSFGEILLTIAVIDALMREREREGGGEITECAPAPIFLT